MKTAVAYRRHRALVSWPTFFLPYLSWYYYVSKPREHEQEKIEHSSPSYPIRYKVNSFLIFMITTHGCAEDKSYKNPLRPGAPIRVHDIYPIQILSFIKQNRMSEFRKERGKNREMKETKYRKNEKIFRTQE